MVTSGKKPEFGIYCILQSQHDRIDQYDCNSVFVFLIGLIDC